MRNFDLVVFSFSMKCDISEVGRETSLSLRKEKALVNCYLGVWEASLLANVVQLSAVGHLRFKVKYLK